MSIAKKSLIGVLVISAVAVLAAAISVSSLNYETADQEISRQVEAKLIALREVEKAEIDEYLGIIQKQILTYSSRRMTREAAQGFIDSFYQFETTEQPSLDEMKSQLSDYYTTQFGELYKEKNPAKRSDAKSLIAGLTDLEVTLQYHLIANNPNPLGSKDSLEELPFDSEYGALHARYHAEIREFLQAFAYYDIFIIDAQTGNIVYSVFKELDYATSLLKGPYRRSGLAEVFKQVRYASDENATAFSSFKPYTPSYEDPAAFIASPIQDEKGKTIAVLAFQMPIDEVNKILTHSQKWKEKGFGDTGESYLVGADYKAQSLSRELLEAPEAFAEGLRLAGVSSDLIDIIRTKGTNVGYQDIRTPGVESALAGQSGYGMFENASGERVLSAYAPIEFEGERMALLLEMDHEEAFAFRSDMIMRSVFATVIVSLLILVVVAAIVWRYVKVLSRDLDAAVTIADTVANGEKADIPERKAKDEIANLLKALGRMQNELIGELESRERESTRVKMALDVCDTNVMMADLDCNIIYMNHSMHQTMGDAEQDLRRDLPQFEAASLMGANIDIFHKNPSHQRNLLSALSDTYRTQIEVGGRTFNLVATPIFDDAKERLGTVVEWSDLTESLRRQQEESAIAESNARIKTALDNVSANVMMADSDRKIIYTNKAVIATLRHAQEAIRTELPNFDVDNLMGGSIDQFHKNPAHQQNLLEQLTDEYSTRINVGGRYMDLTVNPVNDPEGKRLGTVIEWMDRTAEVAIQKEIDGIVSSANDGDLSARVTLDNKQGAFLSLSEGLNALLERIDSFVQDMGTVFRAMAEGDLSSTIDRAYRGQFEEIRGNANNTINKLTSVMHQIKNTSASVRVSSQEVAQGSDDLSRRTESQASSLEETASSMEEITATVKHTTDNALQASELAGVARSKADSGGAVVQDAVHAMTEILDSSKKINDIIGVIDEIAFQTNLLALNAAVEAARAGEQGRGFAVVAGEVRTLSQRSAAAAKEIKDLIRDSVTKVESGSILVNQSGETLSEIVDAVEKVALMIQDVAAAAREQNSGIAQINQAITQMDEMTQQNAALVEQTSAASRSMSEEASSMSNLISFFRLGGASESIQAPVQPRVPEQELKTYKPSSGKPDDPISNYLDDFYN